MAREVRPVIAINEKTGERREYGSLLAASKDLGVTHTCVIIALGTMNSVRGWKVYDTPDNIRKRIEGMEETIKMLEG